MHPLERIRVPLRSVAKRAAPPRSRRTPALAAAILVLGLVGSFAGSLWWRANVHDEQHDSFATTAADVTATLHTMLRRDADFVVAVRAMLTMEPNMSASRFERWFSTLQGRRRQTGSLGTSVVLPFSPRERASLQARRNADPAFRAFVGDETEPLPSSGGAPACTVAAGVLVAGPLQPTIAHMVQADWCSPDSPIGRVEAPALRAETDTGELFVLPATVQGIRTTFFETAFYNAHRPTATVAERRAAVAGWLVSSFDLQSLIHAARSDHRGLGLALYHANPGAAMALVTRGGRVARSGDFRRRTTFDIEGPWALSVSQSHAASGLSANLQGALTFAVGAFVSLLLFAIVRLLTRSRERALGLVREKTGELRHQALHDPLTGLPNRPLALDRLGQMLTRARRTQVPVAVLYIDLDGFKHVNDTFGHAAGDELLRIVAKRLGSFVRGGDTAARLSGDEFVVLLEEPAPGAGPEPIAERLLETLRQPYDLSARVRRWLSLTASIGIAVETHCTADELLRNADLALYEAKARGGDCCELFDASLRSASEDRLTLELDLTEALERDELFMLYQPTVDLRSERMTGAEALIRWEHPTRGVVEPSQFVPIAERSGMIVPIGRWALFAACRQGAAWARDGHALGVAVNVSMRQLETENLVEDVRRALLDSGLEPSRLTLEITETALMRNAEASVTRLHELKALGVRIAIDDFGTGYSSLAYLRQFPADSLKIDRSFVAGIVTSRESAALIDTVVQLARSLGIATLAEGIEDEAQLRALQLAGCERGQGFLFSRPVEAEAVATLHEHAVTTGRPVRALPGASADSARSFHAGEHVEDPMARL